MFKDAVFRVSTGVCMRTAYSVHNVMHTAHRPWILGNTMYHNTSAMRGTTYIIQYFKCRFECYFVCELYANVGIFLAGCG